MATAPPPLGLISGSKRSRRRQRHLASAMRMMGALYQEGLDASVMMRSTCWRVRGRSFAARPSQASSKFARTHRKFYTIKNIRKPLNPEVHIYS